MAGSSHDVRDAVQGFAACPTCRQTDRVADVPAVRRYEVRRKMSGNQWITVPTKLGKALEPVPPAKLCSYLFAYSIMGLLPAIGLLIVHSSSASDIADQYSHDVFPLWPAVLAFACVGLLVLGGIAAYAYRAPIRRGRAMAEEVCERGWFCERCRIVYFQPGIAPLGADADRAYSLKEFKKMVFSAGGYGNRA